MHRTCIKVHAIYKVKEVVITEKEHKHKSEPVLTLEARENQLISKAIDEAERRIEAGTASSQIIVHYLRLGSAKEKLEEEILKEQKKLLVAKTQQIADSKRTEELFAEAMKAMATYSGVREHADD